MRVPLVSGAYQSRSLIAGAQRCVNLYPEENPDPQAPVPVTHYPTPGLTLFAQPASPAGARGAYRTTGGDLYVVLGTTLFFVDENGAFTKIGQVADRPTPISMSDNGLVLVLVDGSSIGYAVDLTKRTFGAITDPNFLGATRVDYVDTYFIFNKPGSAQWYISLGEVTYAMLTAGTGGSAFDSLDIAAKTGSADNVVSVISVHGAPWIIGGLTTEIWYNSGSADFTFARQPGAFIEHGCVAPYSVAKQDVSVFWLSQDREGHGIVVKGSGYEVARISTHAIEADIQSYARLDDAIGYCFQQQGHAFYVLTFPTADKTWAYELKTEQWHELAWADGNGLLHRHRAACCCFAYGRNIVADWQNGTIYVLDPNVYTDAGAPVVRIRTFPHMISDGRRVSYSRMIIDMQTGGFLQTGLGGYDLALQGGGDLLLNTIGKLYISGVPIIPYVLSIRWSDTRGASWSDAVSQDIGKTGDYLKSLVFNRLGMARDRVFEVSWSAPLRTALNGAFIETVKHAS